jgi:diguanylate cyclase (GGDEF)-like protein/PAS domain S-box-containing protein
LPFPRYRGPSAGPGADVTIQPDLDDAATEGRIRAERIDVAMRLAPSGVICDVSVVSVVVVTFWNSASRIYLATLATIVVALSAIALTACWRWRRNGKPAWSSARDIRLLVLVASAYGLCLASIPVVLFVASSPDYRLLIASTTAGLIAVSLSVSAVPLATTVSAGAIIVGAFYALAGTGEPFYIIVAVLLLLYSNFIIFAAHQLGAVLLARIMSEIKVERQKNVIGFLLNEFEESASDWIWEIGVDGRIRRPSARFCQICGRNSAELEGLPLSALLDAPANEPAPAGERGTIWKAIESGATFRNAVVSARVLDEVRWWSLSGKPILDSEGRSIGFRGVGSDVTLQKKAEERLAHLACFDGLTGLPNRHLFNDRLNEACETDGSSGAAFSVLCLDLDEFKSVNDAFGHAIGDKLLGVVAARLRGCIDPGHTAARLSGDEYAILALGSDLERASVIANRIIAAIAEPMMIEGNEISLHVSIGIAFSPTMSPSEIMRRADLALYRAKREGRNCYRFYEAKMDAEVEARRKLAADLRAAQTRGEFVLHFQPVVAAHGLETSGFEALLRWRHPILGLVAPSKFIPVAEENGAIVAIGEWVIREACRVAASWPESLSVAVNLSPVQLRHSNVVKIVESALEESGLAASRLEVEITETTLMDGNRKTTKALNRLLRMGVRLVLDDFGTGYSSLSYLRKIRFNKIKIDKSFVQNLPDEQGSLAIVRSIVGLGQSFGMKITAEGVENAAQLACLRQEGCHFLQGFLFSPAKPEAHLPRLLDFRQHDPEPPLSKPIARVVSR